MISKLSINRLGTLLPHLLLTVPLLLVAIVLAVKADINSYLIAFCASGYVLISALVFFHIGSRHYQQSNILSDLLDALIDGDYTFRGKDLYSEHFQSLLERINQLAATLQTQTVALQEKQLLIQQVIDHMDAAVLAIDEQQKLVFCNRAAKRLFGIEEQQSLLKPSLLDTLQKGENGKAVMLDAALCANMNPGGEFLLHRDSFITQGKVNQLIVLSELGQLLHHNQSAAWQRLVRVISHELNNSMAPVNTISRTMLKQSEKHALPQSHVQGLQVIRERCEHMIEFIASYAKITQLPKPNRQPVKIAELIDNSTALFANRKMVVQGDLDIELYCDPAQLQQVLINLLKNADEAMFNDNNMADGEENIQIVIEKTENQCLISIIDGGEGIANPDNLFVPFYTTKNAGSGIGLMLCQQIINNHFGRLTLTNRLDNKGAVATITMPN